MNMEVVEEKMIRPRLRNHGGQFVSEDVLINVLSKLPVTTLLRFRCVCKRWRYLISDDPYFFQLHSQQSKSKPPHFFFSSKADGPKSHRPLLKSIKGNSIGIFKVNYTNFWAKLVPTRFDLVCIHGDMFVQICNPSTHEFMTLPKHHLPFGYSSVGFGYVESTDEYKVVGLVNPDYLLVEDEFSVEAADFTTKCHVFTLGKERRGSVSCSSSSSSSWAWREVMDAPYHVNYSTPPAFINGAVHWLVLYNSLMDHDVFDGEMIDPHNTIIAFDIEREEFRLVPHPEGCPDVKSLQNEDKDIDTIELQLVELRGFLCLSYAGSSKMDIWMFKDYYYKSGDDHISGTWEKEYSIDLSVLPHSYQLLDTEYYYYAPRDIDDKEVLIETHHKGLGFYLLQSMTFKGLMHGRQIPNLEFSFYVESLRSLKQSEQGRPFTFFL